MEKTITLKPNNKLLNADFDGYKLSSDADITFYSHCLDDQGLEKKGNSTCYLHTRLESLHNHVFGDPFNPMFVYCFSSRGHLLKFNYSKDSRLSPGEVVWQADFTGSAEESCDDEKTDCLHYFASVCFPSSELATVSNGQGSLHILETGDRSSTQSWVETFECSTQRGVLIHARLLSGPGSEQHLHCLFISVSTPENLRSTEGFVVLDEKLEKSTASSVHLINWISLTYNGETWQSSQERTVAGEGSVEYCSLDGEAMGLILLCHKNYSFVYDSKVQLIKPKPASTDEKKPPKFTFMQSSDDIIVWINVGDVKKHDLQVKITTKEMSISVQENEILHGRLLNPIQADSSVWTINEGKLEVTLMKATEGLSWPNLFHSEDPQGEEHLDPQLVEEVNQRLAHLTSDKFAADPELERPAYNPGQFEACDEVSEDLILIRLDGSTHAVSSIGFLGPTQHLFNSRVEGSVIPAFCLRHDVDGILWLPENEDRFVHVATYNAFGYVKASKSMAKFTCASPDNSYVAVADVKSHIYVFFQPEAFGGELRNRKSGKRMNTVARQVVISMKSHDEICGLHASPYALFVLTSKSIYTYCLRNS